MLITICSSMSFYQEILECEKKLKKLGHQVLIPLSTHYCLTNSGLPANDDPDYCRKNNVLIDHYKKIERSDAVLVLNLKKGTIENYIGGSVLGEILIAYYLKKRIFLYNDFPREEDLRYAFEVKLTNPQIIRQDLRLIK